MYSKNKLNNHHPRCFRDEHNRFAYFVFLSFFFFFFFVTKKLDGTETSGDPTDLMSAE